MLYSTYLEDVSVKILVINDKFISGGAEVYSQNLNNLLQENGHESSLITFYSDSEFVKSDSEKNISIHTSRIGKFVSKFAIYLPLYIQLRKKFKAYTPDLIIVNNIFDTKFTLLHALKGYHSIRIVHDYSIMCIYSCALHDDDSICALGYKGNECNKYCVSRGQLQNRIKIWNYRRIESLNKKRFQFFVSPSQKLAEQMKAYGYTTYCVNNYIDIPSYDNAPKPMLPVSSKCIYLYVGKINHYKGILDFIPHFIDFSQDTDCELWIVGSTETDADDKKINEFIQYPCIKYLGSLPHNEILNLMTNAYCVITPSKWAENYPTVILEAMICHTLVIGSSRGGIPEMLDNHSGLLFDWETPSTIMSILKTSIQLDQNEYADYTNNAYSYAASKTKAHYMSELERLFQLL